MTTLMQGRYTDILLQIGGTLTVDASNGGGALVTMTRAGSVGASVVVSNTTVTYGPFDKQQAYRVQSIAGTVNTSFFNPVVESASPFAGQYATSVEYGRATSVIVPIGSTLTVAASSGSTGTVLPVGTFSPLIYDGTAMVLGPFTTVRLYIVRCISGIMSLATRWATAASPAPVFTIQPSISPGSGTAGTTVFSASDGTASNATGYTRRWLLSGTAIGTGATVAPVAAGSLVLEVTATGSGGTATATSAAVTVASVAASLPVIPLSLSGANPNTVFPPPLVTGNLPAGYQTGDVIRLYIDNGYDTTLNNSVTHTLTDADATGGTISFGTAVSSITSGVHAFAIRGERGSAFSLTSATVVHGDTIAPTISGSTPASIAEQMPMLVTVTASEPCYFAIGGADAGLVEKVGSEPVTSIGLRLVGNALLDYETKASYAVTVTPTDRGSNVGAASTVNLAVVDKDDVPDAIVFAAAEGVALGAQASSAIKTISGLDAGIFASVGVTGGSYKKNGAAATTASSTVVNGDTIQLVGTAPSATGRTQVALNYGGLSTTWEIRTVGYAPASNTTWMAGAGNAVLSNGNHTATGPAVSDHVIARTATSHDAVSGAPIKYYIEFEVTNIVASKAFAFLSTFADESTANDHYIDVSSRGTVLYLDANGANYFDSAQNSGGNYFGPGMTSYMGDRIGMELTVPGSGATTGFIRFSRNGVFGASSSTPYAYSYIAMTFLGQGAAATIVAPNYQPSGTTLWDPAS